MATGESQTHLRQAPIRAPGASAGGVAALKSFVGRMGADLGLAFVVVVASRARTSETAVGPSGTPARLADGRDVRHAGPSGRGPAGAADGQYAR